MIKFPQQLSKRTIIITLIVILVFGFGSYLFLQNQKNQSGEFLVIKKTNILQEVSVTGKVKPAKSVELAFEKSGRIVSVNAIVGDVVKVDSPIASIDSNELSAQLAEAEANLKAQKAKLSDLQKGPRVEDLQLQTIKIENAKVAVSDARRNSISSVSDAYAKADDAVRNRIDQFFSNPKSANPQLTIYCADQQLKIDTETQRFIAEKNLNAWKLSLNDLSLTTEEEISIANKNLDQINELLDKMALVINSLLPSSTLSQTSIDSYKTNTFSARTNINSAISSLASSAQSLNTAKSNLALYEQEMALKKAGSSIDTILAQQAQVEQIEASIKNIKTQINKNTLRSPINGTITRQDAKRGQIVSANTPITSIISESKFEIEANIPEADIAKVKLNDPTKVTLDAYGSDVFFNAIVTAIDPAETIISGVATYKTTFQFIKKDDRIKSGMTANIDIQTNSKENIIAIPQRAVITKDGNKFVLIYKEKTIPEERKVTTGLKSSNGLVEITEGLSEGEKIIPTGEIKNK